MEKANMNAHTDLVERLRIKVHNEKHMGWWDSWVKYYRTAKSIGSWPRDGFESLLDFADEEREEASVAILGLLDRDTAKQIELDAANFIIAEQFNQLTEANARADRLEAALKAAVADEPKWGQQARAALASTSPSKEEPCKPAP